MSESPRERRRDDVSHRHRRDRDRSRSPARMSRRREGGSPERHRRHDRDHREDSHRHERGRERSYRDADGREDSYRHDRQRRERSPQGEDRWRRPEAQLREGPPELGSIHRGTVKNVRPFGIFVELEGFRRHGLVHNSQVSEDIAFSREDEDEAKVKAMEFFAPVGSQVWAKVTEVRDDGGGPPKINCSMRAVSQDDGADLDPDNAAAGRRAQFDGVVTDTPPQVGQILQAAVATVKPFGLFVKLRGYRANGLVHLSQVSDHLDIGREESDEAKVAALASVHAVGDPLWVKVVEVTEDLSGRTRVACSIKLVEQKSGADLDPSGVKWQPRGEGGGGPPSRAPIQATVNVAEGGKIDWGYLKAGDKQYSDSGKQYDMLGDEVLALPPPPPPPPGVGAAAAQNGGHAAAEAPADKIGSVEEALAILEKYRKGKAHKDKKAKKKGKDKKEKKAKKAKKKKRKEPDASSSDDDD